MKKVFVPFLIFYLLSVFGCLPATERRVVLTPKPEVIAPAFVPVDILDNKISFLNEMLQIKDLSKEDRNLASDLIKTYRSLKRTSRQFTETEYREFIRSLFDMLGAIDESYFSEKKKDSQDYSGTIGLFSEKKNKILDAYLARDFKGVINKCLDLKDLFGPDALTPEIGLVFSLSLAKAGMRDEAINIGEGIVRELEPRPDLIYLNAMLAEWQLALGHREKALHIYEKLTDILDERKTLLKRLSRKINSKPVSDTIANIIPKKQPQFKYLSTEDQGPMKELFKEVDSLVKMGEYEQAKLLLIRHRIRFERDSDIETIDQALKNVNLAEEKYEKERSSAEALEKEAFATARKLVEGEKYEEAIAKLKELKDSQQLGPESEELKHQAVEKHITSERNKAAKLFLAAKDAKDPLMKKKYLKSSHDILKALIDNYPSSPLINKINSNIMKVTEELDKL